MDRNSATFILVSLFSVVCVCVWRGGGGGGEGAEINSLKFAMKTKSLH